MPFVLHTVCTDQLFDSSLRFCELYNSSPLASTDAIAKSQGFMLFTHIANSAGLGRQCFKGPQDSLQELSWGELRQRSSLQGVKGSYILASNNLAPNPVPKKRSKPYKNDLEHSIWWLQRLCQSLTFIVGVSNDAKVFFWQSKWSKRL